jgi:hypothetical protein
MTQRRATSAARGPRAPDRLAADSLATRQPADLKRVV